jgi:hypothetical protein
MQDPAFTAPPPWMGAPRLEGLKPQSLYRANGAGHASSVLAFDRREAICAFGALPRLGLNAVVRRMEPGRRHQSSYADG